jgi:hypothetical protein
MEVPVHQPLDSFSAKTGLVLVRRKDVYAPMWPAEVRVTGVIQRESPEDAELLSLCVEGTGTLYFAPQSRIALSQRELRKYYYPKAA